MFVMHFQEAYLRLQEIHHMLQGNEKVDIEQLIVLQKEAKACFELCQDQLKKARNELDA